MGAIRNVQIITVLKPEGKKLLGRPKRRWENVIMGIKEIRREDVEWIHLSLDRD
jgi:hypothetical protein